MKRFSGSILIAISFLLLIYGSSCTRHQEKASGFQDWNKTDSILKLITEPVFKNSDFKLTDFGGVGDGVFDNKAVFDTIISKCSAAGGGRIIVPPGTYRMNGSIHLKSNINLYLEEGSKLVFSSNPDDYLPVVLTSWEGTRLYNYSPFIYAFGQKNLAITGKGEIDGEASEIWAKWKENQNNDKLLTRKMNNENVPLEQRIFGKGHLLRPHLIQFYECENILVDGIKITDSPFWCLHLLFSRNVIVRNVRYDAQNVNNDGIDPESSENILIENIEFNNHDDNIAIKSGRDLEARTLNRPSRNIIIRNCKFGGYNAFAVGSEMSGGVSHVFVEDCSFGGDVIYGIYLKGNLDRGGTVSNIYVRNVRFDSTESAILIDSYYKNEGSCCPPQFENIYIENVTCKSTRDFGISLLGSAGEPLKNIFLKNIVIDSSAKPFQFRYVENLTIENVKINGAQIPEKPSNYAQ